VVSHGIPYMALIYLNDIQKKNTTNPYRLLFTRFKRRTAVCSLYFNCVLRRIFWKSWFGTISLPFPSYDFFFQLAIYFGSLLTVPQFTHYLLDGFYLEIQVKIPLLRSKFSFIAIYNNWFLWFKHIHVGPSNTSLTTSKCHLWYQ
jgi:hypothetical protein